MNRLCKQIAYVAVLAPLVLVGCGEGEGDRIHVPADAPGFVKGKAVHPSIKIGKPYRVKGEKYYPKYQPDYDEEGLASWYGPNFHGKATANGEKYNQWAMTAAHKTLPMPSMVRVTNLATGKAIIVRINDRGPFADGRIIDLSRAAAEALGTRIRGVAKVRVEYLPEQTERYIAKLQLKKPKSMRELDLARAQAAVASTAARSAPAPALHAIEGAESVPEQFVFEQTFSAKPVATTVSARGVVMEEIGYAQDAFSVLSEAAIAAPAFSAPAVANPSHAPWQQPITAQSRYFVRAGTFANKANAYALAEKIGSIAATKVEPLTIRGQHFWRVSLGPAFNRAIAEEIRDRLTDHVIYDAAIVKEE